MKVSAAKKPYNVIRKLVRRAVTKPSASQCLERDVVQINDTEKTISSARTSLAAKVAEASQIGKAARGVNFDILDKSKTYIGMQYEEHHIIAKQIVKFTKKYCPNARVPAHVFALAFKDGEWWVYESHIVTKKELGLKRGSHKLKAQDWLKLCKNYEYETDIFEADVNLDVLDKNAGQPYSLGDAFKHIVASLFDRNGKQSDCSGLICSEYVAMATKDICDFYHLKPWCVTPAHFKDYMVRKGAQQVNA